MRKRRLICVFLVCVIAFTGFDFNVVAATVNDEAVSDVTIPDTEEILETVDSDILNIYMQKRTIQWIRKK